MSASLEATETRRVELVGDVAHELRTPLSTLDGYLEGLEDGVIAPNDETWRLLRGETARLTRLVDALQELWRAEARRLPLKIEAVDASSVAVDVVGRFAPQATARRIAIGWDVPSGLTVRADRDRLIQILGNYLANAIRYSPDGASVQLQAGRLGDFVEFAVSDHGPGPDARGARQGLRAFLSRRPVGDRRALGWNRASASPLPARSPNAMDGRVRADSNGPGTGSTFSVALPTAWLWSEHHLANLEAGRHSALM